MWFPGDCHVRKSYHVKLPLPKSRLQASVKLESNSITKPQGDVAFSILLQGLGPVRVLLFEKFWIRKAGKSKIFYTQAVQRFAYKLVRFASVSSFANPHETHVTTCRGQARPAVPPPHAICLRHFLLPVSTPKPSRRSRESDKRALWRLPCHLDRLVSPAARAASLGGGRGRVTVATCGQTVN